MRPMRLMFAYGAIAGVMMLSSGPQAFAADEQLTVREIAINSDVSAQKKKKVSNRRHWQRNAGYRTYYVDPTRSPYYLRPGVAPSFGYIGPPGYAGEFAWRRSIGQCVEDLGYGRWSACGSR